MVTKQEYSLMSAAVYNDARGKFNTLDITSLGWTTVASEGGSAGGVFSSGLSINAYKKGNEIVIACKGTDFLLGTNNPQTYSDLIADFGLGGSLGFSSSQLFQAALFYQRVKEQNPGATMTFTGHSLGAGLASVLSVWFDKPAIIFADAPFEFTALNPLVQAYVASHLALNGYVDSAFTSFISTAPVIYSAREAQVTGYYVKDEVLNNWLGALYFVVGDNKEIDVGGTDLLSPLTLHSIVLHASLLITEQLRLDTFALPHLLARIFDENLYAPKLESSTQDFLTKLLQAQIPLVGGDMSSGPLTHFAEDMRKLGAGIDGSSPEAQDALIAQSIEWYFHKGATPSAQSFFTQTGNLLQYTPIQDTDMAGTQSKAAHYVDPWLDLISAVHGILRRDVKYEQWNVVSGTESATAVAKDSSKTQIFIGGAGGDTLIGGNKADIFYAGEGNDSVDGGAGNDILAGGTGNDIYQFTGTFDFDTIVDNDGWGSIQVDGNPLQGGKKVEGLDNVWRNEEQGYTFALAGSGADRSLLIVKDGSLDAIRVKGWQDGQLGLTMDSSPAPSIAIQHIYHGDQRAPLTGGSYDWSSTHWAADGTLVGGVVEENFFDVILGTLDRDRISGLGGKDVLQGWLGDDEIDGGEGDDLIAGGPGRDFILGGAGDDIIMGAGSFYYLDYNPYSYSSVQAWNPVFGINALAQVQFDPVGTNQWVNGAQTWIDLSSPDPDVIAAGAGDDTVFGSSYDDLVAGDAGDDVLWGMEGNDVLAGGTGGDVLVGDVDDVDYALSQAQGSDLPPVIYGNDFLDGGDGNDVLLGGGAGDALFGGGGNDVLAGDGSSRLFLDGSYINRLVSQDLQGDDFLDGGDGDDTLTGAGGNDVLIGGAGADTLDGGRGNDSFSAGAGDTVTDSQGIDALVLADGQPASVTADGADLLLGYGNSGTLRIVDALRGSMEVIDGLRVSDWLNAYLNDAVHVASIVEGQSLSGGSGDDILASSHENVRLSGRTGNDSYILGNAGATVDELANEGTDTVRSTISHSLAENVENLALTGTASVNGTGNDWDNVMTGNAAANVLAGGTGKDTLDGGDGDDRVYGESGDDVLYASYGNDTLAGGDGLDTYVLGYGADRNTVMDDSAEGSIIKLGSAGIKFEDLSAVRRDDDLVVEVRGTSAAMRIKDYYAATQTSWVFEDAQGNMVTGEALVEASRTDWTQLQANLLKDFQSSALGSISRGYADGGYTQGLDGSWYLAANYAMGIAKTYDVRTEWSKDVHTPLNDPGHPWVTTSSYVSYAEWATQQWGQETARDWTATITFQPNTVASGTGTIQSYTYATSTENAWSAVQWTADSGTHSESEWAYESSAGWPVEHPTEAINHYTRYDIDSDYYEGTVGPLTFQEPGAAAQAGNLPDYVAVDFLHQQFDYNLGPSLLADGDQTVWADQYSAVIGGIGNNTIYDAGFAYGGTGNAQLIGGGTLMAGTGDQYLERGDTMVVGDGHDTVVGHDSSRILVNPHNLGIDLIGQDFDWESDIDYRGQSYKIEAIYRAMGYEDWKINYQYGGKFRLDFGEDFEGYFDSLEDARAAFVPSDAWPSFDDAMAYPYTTWRYIEPLTALYETPYTSVEDPASGLAASSYYAAHGITATMLTANDFSALRPLLDAELLPKGIVSFGPGLSLADLTLSWGEAAAPMDGATHVTLDILWGPDQGIRILMPRSGDKISSVAQQFEFSDGTVSSLLDLIALAPTAPDNDTPTGVVTINGSLAQNQVLTATNTLADADGLGSVTYQWQANGAAIAGATSATLTLGQAQVGKTISVKASYTDAQGTAEGVTSAATALVANVNDAPTGTVTVSGTTAQNQTLTATSTLADADGLGALSYQWMANGTAIAGAIASTLALTQAHVDKAISVKASYMDALGSAEAVSSTATAAVANVNDVPALTSAKAVLAGGTEDTAYTVTQASLLTGFSDADGNALSVVNLSAGNGALSAFNAATGSWTFTPNANYNGTVNLSYGASDGITTTNASQSLTLAAVNDAPTLTGAQATFSTGMEDTAYVIAEASLLVGFGDVDGNTLSVVNLSVNNGGLSAFNTSTRSWSFTPNVNYNGAVDLNFSVSDGTAITAATQRLVLTAVNDAPTFAVSGKVSTDFGGTSNNVQALLIQSDGKIVIAGNTGWSGNAYSNVGLARYLADGTLDTSFDSDGKVTTGVPGNIMSAALQADGKIIVAGERSMGGKTAFSMLRYNSNGSLDTTFGSGGEAYTDFGTGWNRAESITLQRDGKILLGGTVYGATGHTFALARYNSNGSLDTSFDGDGKVTTNMGMDNWGYSVAVQDDNKVVVAGFSNADFALARYNADGSLDTSLDGDGKLITKFAIGGGSGALGVAMQADGKILAGGAVGDSFAAGGTDFGLTRYLADGRLDTSFSEDGKLTTAVGTESDYLQGIAVQADGKILAAGYSKNGIKANDFSLVRYNIDDSLDAGFGSNGVVLTDFSQKADQAYDVKLQSDGKILVSGISFNTRGSAFALARYNPDGSLDATFAAANTLDGRATYAENSPAVLLDNSVAVYDAELAARGNYAGASISLYRHGGANADDVFAGASPLSFRASTIPGQQVINAELSYDGTIGTVSNANGVLTLTFNSSATQDRVNLALSSLTYSNRSDNPPASVEIDWVFSDGTATAQGTGGAQSVIGSSILTITARNDAPLSANQVLSFNEDSTRVFAVSDFGFSDPDIGDSLRSVVIKSIPGAGSLRFNGNAVGVNQSIQATDIVAGKLTFTPAANANGDGYASFGFQVSDGSLLSGTYTANLNVTPVRDDMDLASTSGIDRLLGDQIDIGSYDRLSGLAGDDFLDGKAGNDILIGGAGSDAYQMGRGYGADTVQENDATPGNTDVLSFGAGVNANQLWLSQVGNDLSVGIIGTADKAVVQNWYLGSQYHVEQIWSGDGKVLQDNRVDQLVQAMAGFSPPAMGQIDLSAAYAAALVPVMGSAWH